MWNKLDPLLSLTTLRVVVDALKCETTTPVQAACIPLFLKHKDVAVEAITGSGKTLAFVIPVIEILLRREETLKKHDVGAIIVSPTRELAIQTHDVVTCFLKEVPCISSKLLIGGTNPVNDVETFEERGGHILVGTPGRLEDFLQRNINGINVAACIKSLDVLVLDEADRLLDMGFKKSLTTILSILPKQRRTGIFSATQTEDVEDLILAGMRNPVRISIKQKSLTGVEICEQKTPISLKNLYIVCATDKKFNYLVEFLKDHKQEKMILFVSTCACVDYFAKVLQKLLPKREILSIHRKKDNRIQISSKFRSLKNGILICTDVMGRGMDIPDVGWVVQFDPPSSASNFVHRCGRTARIGNVGNALVMLFENEEPYVEFIRLNQKVPLEVYTIAQPPDIIDKVKALAMKDRAVYEKGLRAYVSFVQSYVKHECNLIFRLKDLNLGRLATGFGLLHLPKMPEINKKDGIDFESTECDYGSIPYSDKQREKHRKQKLLEAPKEFDKEKSDRRVNKPRNQQGLPKLNKRNGEGVQHKRKRKFEDIDLEELSRDARIIKKFKSGKISKDEFESRFKDF